MNLHRRRALGIALAMGSTSVLAQLWKAPRSDSADGSQTLLSTIVPASFGDWHMDAGSTSFVRAASGRERIYKLYDQLLELAFVNSAGYRIMLSMASSKGSSASMQLHMPELCYTYNGYRIDQLESASLLLAGRDIPVRRLRAELAARKEPITYWTIVGGKAGLVDFGNWDFRWHRILLALKREAMTGTLVRVSSIDPDSHRAYSVQAQFADAMVQKMAQEDRARLIGDLGQA